MSFAAVLFLILLVLKLTGLIAWSWIWVTAPLWIPILLVLAIWILAALGFGVVAWFRGR